MARTKATNPPNPNRRPRPAITPEAREGQMIALAMDLVEQRLIDGTASSQETTHFLKLATEKSRYENKLLEAQTAMAMAKKDQLESQKRTEELFAEAIKAFKNYSGQRDDEEGDPDEYEDY